MRVASFCLLLLAFVLPASLAVAEDPTLAARETALPAFDGAVDTYHASQALAVDTACLHMAQYTCSVLRASYSVASHYQDNTDSTEPACGAAHVCAALPTLRYYAFQAALA